MMTLRDSVRLAGAKLKTHRVRTGIVVAIASLLFAGIVLVLTMLTGAVRSMQSFGAEGLGSRYIVQARPIFDQQSIFMGTADILNDLKTRTTQLKNDKKATAKRLNVPYDPTTDQSLPVFEAKNGSGGSEYFLNTANPEAREAINTYARSLQHISFSDFSSVAKQNNAKGVYRSSTNPMNGGFGFGAMYEQPTVVPIIDGKEQVVDQAKASSAGEPRGVATLMSLGLSYFDADLLLPFVLPGQSLASGKDGSVPVIAPVSAAEQILSMPSLPATATAQQRLDRLVELRKDIAGKTFELCYRNRPSGDLLQQAKEQEKEIAFNKGKTGYTAPALQYAVPSDACGAITIKKDTRSADEKKTANNELEFKRTYEVYNDPDQQIMKIRIVGFSQDLSFEPGFSARSIVEGVFRTGLGSGWFAPAEAISEGSALDKINPKMSKLLDIEQFYYAEFSDLASAKRFTQRVGCSSEVSSVLNFGPPEPGQQDPRVVDCFKRGTYFDISPFGNNAGAIEDLRQGVWKAMRYVAPVVLVLAALVLMGIVGKIIADSRRETAVFRALGATRFAIAQIYLTYSLFIAVFIMMLAFVFGSGAALLLSNKLTPEASVSAVLAYNAQDVHKQFTFYGVDITYVAIVLGLVVLSALLSTILPLLTNIRRNPIRDMRDEN